jgi:steroid 5-alpha reductase family enzyme
VHLAAGPATVVGMTAVDATTSLATAAWILAMVVRDRGWSTRWPVVVCALAATMCSFGTPLPGWRLFFAGAMTVWGLMTIEEARRAAKPLQSERGAPS